MVVIPPYTSLSIIVDARSVGEAVFMRTIQHFGHESPRVVKNNVSLDPVSFFILLAIAKGTTYTLSSNILRHGLELFVKNRNVFCVLLSGLCSFVQELGRSTSRRHVDE